MRLLDRYLLRELIVPLVYCLSGFLIFWVSADLIGELESLRRFNLTALDIFQYYLVKTPEMLVLIVPIGLLLALLYALTNHSRHQELTAIRAAGVSLWRLAMPYFAVGCILSILLFAVDEVWVPQSTEAADQIKYRRQSDSGPNVRAVVVQDTGFTNTRQRRQWFFKSYNLLTHEMIQPHVVWVLDTGTAWNITAERANYVDGGWVFSNAQEQIFPAVKGAFPTVNKTNLLVMADFNESPEEIESELKITKVTRSLDPKNMLREVRKAQLSVRELLQYRRLHNENSREMALLDTKLHERIASPWRALVVVFIALPFGAASGRRNVYVGVASSVLICFAYYVLAQASLLLVAGGWIWPSLAAWLPNLIFAGLGIFLIYRVK